MSPEEDRPVEELKSVTDCVEEILFSIQRAQVFVLVDTALERGRRGVDPYDRVEAIVRRAQALPLGAAAGSPPQT